MDIISYYLGKLKVIKQSLGITQCQEWSKASTRQTKEDKNMSGKILKSRGPR